LARLGALSAVSDFVVFIGKLDDRSSPMLLLYAALPLPRGFNSART